MGGVLSQVHLQELGPGLVKPSQTLSLTYAVSEFSITTSSYCLSWIHQPVAKGLEWMGDTSKNQFSLQLSSMTTKDTAVYYCARHSYGGTNYNPTQKSRLSTTRDKFKNQVYLPLNSLRSKDTALYYCARQNEGKSV
ncbi:hypothetical protein QTO34_012601 [Cnephaeus nilssonii]|uniref:Immunoglobulin V-set domain-containing protein n=1 Tax=Cnephaeus nilssonii TaxID=3371016 RepID=A0AA40HBS9_CNENI|nr:hypothetical protein QTO34_012601 [Eptesicus nilssonii]